MIAAERAVNRITRLVSRVELSSQLSELCVSCDAPPRAGQFFMLKPLYSGAFLPRPLGAAVWDGGANTVSFIIEQRGAGTAALRALAPGAQLEITGPLGNHFAALLPPSARKIALVAGGTGIAPLALCAREFSALPGFSLDAFAGFKKGWRDGGENRLIELLKPSVKHLLFASEDGVTPEAALRGNGSGGQGLVTAFLDAAAYDAVICCGPLAMMRAAASLCKKSGVPCLVSMEKKMACGVGACLGCGIETARGRRRCCVEGPVFDARELFDAA